MQKGFIIAAVRNDEEFSNAATSKSEIIFDLCPNILNIHDRIKLCKKNNKKLFIHIDLAEGIGKDKYAMEFLKGIGLDGIISTRTNLIKFAKESDLLTVQRFFAVDSKSLNTAIETLKSSKADMIEIMPGIATKAIEVLKSKVKSPIIAGGLIDSVDEIEKVFLSGAKAVSTGKSDFWNL
ncbi:MAG: glycerol-3-phosphate responsive antiterminator [Clostridia bacterium]|nr:glycerol-3-phosphate responsive antiterminator [Clostridia bacterium]